MKSRIGGAWFAGIRRDVKRVAAGFGLVVGLLASGAANAILICGMEIAIVPDGRDVEFSAGTLGSSFNWDAVAGRSYTVEVIGGPGFAGNNFVIVNNVGFCPIFNLPGLNVTSLQEPLGGDNLGAAAANFTMYRASFIAAATQRMDVSIADNFLGSVNGHLRVYETTLFQPLWGTSGGFHTFWNIANTTMQPCNATLTLLSAAGTTVTSVTKTVPADGAVEVDTIGMMVPLNQIGKATIAHDCAPGALAVDTFLENVTTSAVLPAKIFTRNQLR